VPGKLQAVDSKVEELQVEVMMVEATVDASSAPGLPRP
jgi:hypothetical protein